VVCLPLFPSCLHTWTSERCMRVVAMLTREADSCNCSGTEAGGKASELETDFTGKA